MTCLHCRSVRLHNSDPLRTRCFVCTRGRCANVVIRTTGIGNCIPVEVLKLVELCTLAAHGDVAADRFAKELSDALTVLSSFDEGPDLVLYYKYLLTLLNQAEYEVQLNPADALSASQKRYAEVQLTLFQRWWKNWDGREYAAGCISESLIPASA